MPESEAKTYGQDLMWFAWTNENSPVFGKEKMATFERYFLGERIPMRNGRIRIID